MQGQMHISPVNVVRNARALNWSAETLQISFPGMPLGTAYFLIIGVLDITENGELYIRT